MKLTKVAFAIASVLAVALKLRQRKVRSILRLLPRKLPKSSIPTRKWYAHLRRATRSSADNDARTNEQRLQLQYHLG